MEQLNVEITYYYENYLFEIEHQSYFYHCSKISSCSDLEKIGAPKIFLFI
jgi:hypothetical protein